MERYGGDFYRRPSPRYGGEYQQWGGMPRYDRQYHRPERAGRFYDRDFSGYEQQGGYGYRGGSRYDRGFADRDRGGYHGGGQQGYGRDYMQSQDPSYRYGMRDARPYPSPWNESYAGQGFRIGLGYGQGRGQYIYK